MAFVTPSRQVPLGVTMSAERRRALLDWAREANAWIFEDDYDSEFRYASRPLTPLRSLDADDCVLYAGTFSKVLLPALRLGYLVVPDALVDTFLAVRHYSDFHSAFLDQSALADFIVEGHFERHIRRMLAARARTSSPSGPTPPGTTLAPAAQKLSVAPGYPGSSTITRSPGSSRTSPVSARACCDPCTTMIWSGRQLTARECVRYSQIASRNSERPAVAP
jgi:hypothetical protein